MRHYKVYKVGSRYTIGEFDESYNAVIINDGICQYYWWDTPEAAQEAADAYNAYNGEEWLGQHSYGNDYIHADEADSCSQEMIDLYRLFGATDL